MITIIACLDVFMCFCNGFWLSTTALAFCGSAEIPCLWFLARPPPPVVLEAAGCNTERYLSNSLSSLRTNSSFLRSSCSKAIILLSFIFSSLFFSCSACCSSRRLPILVVTRPKHKQPTLDRLVLRCEVSLAQCISASITATTRTGLWVMKSGVDSRTEKNLLCKIVKISTIQANTDSSVERSLLVKGWLPVCALRF